MTKKEIVKTISEEIGLSQLKTKEIVQRTFNAIVEALVADRRVELRNFGVFEVKERAPRDARNPRTGERVQVPAKLVVVFKPGKEMEARVGEMERRIRQATSVERETPPPPETSQRADDGKSVQRQDGQSPEKRTSRTTDHDDVGYRQ